MSKPGTAAAVALCLAGAANAQTAPSGAPAGQASSYAVEGLTLGSKVKSDSSAYREYKCGPSEQFVGFVWCQKTRRESERRGSFEASYSILHAKDGTIVYVNRSQQPAFLNASEADRDIQNYARKFGGSPGLTRMPRRSGSSDAVLATWGNVELEPLDNDSIKVLGEGKSPRKGLLVDFVSNFTRSAQEGLPIYRIIGGAGFVWAGSYDQKGRGTLRFAAVDASALQPGPVAAQPSPPVAAQPSAPVAAQPPAAPQIEDQEPARKTDLAAAATTAGRYAETTVARLQAELSTAVRERGDAELAAQAAAAKAGRDAEATTARLQAELSTAIKQKREAELAAKAARTDAEIVRKEFEAAMNDANAAKEEVERLKAGGAAPESNATRAVLIGIAAAAILLFSFWAFPSLRSASPRPSVHAEKTDAGEGGGEAAAVPSSFASERSAETEPRVDASELLEQLAKTLGVEDAAAQSQAAAAPDADGDRPAVERQDQQAQQAQTQTDTGGDEGSIPSEKPSDVSVLLSPDEDDRELSKSIVPDSPDAPEAEEINEGAALLPNIRLIRR
jgi:hypothetical protein